MPDPSDMPPWALRAAGYYLIALSYEKEGDDERAMMAMGQGAAEIAKNFAPGVVGSMPGGVVVSVFDEQEHEDTET